MDGNLRISWVVRAAMIAASVATFARAGSCDAGAGSGEKQDAHESADVALALTGNAMGEPATAVATVNFHAQPRLVESSAAATSSSDPAVIFTLNDSGNEPLLFALDTTGAARGTWRLHVPNIDWESLAAAPCAPNATAPCLYVGDTGDNDDAHSHRTIYRLAEPPPIDARPAEVPDVDSVSYTYPDGPHDVEAMFVAMNGDAFLITKRPLMGGGHLRPALVFRIPAAAWQSNARVVAERVDSLPIVPGSAPLRTITDASLSPNAKYLAVRTYMQVFVFAVDPASGRVDHTVAPAACDIRGAAESQGEGISWIDNAGRFVLTSEGRNAPLHLVNCRLP